MKKIIAASVVVLAGAGLIGPKIIGSSVEQEYNRQFEQIPEYSGVKYQHLSFNNGWFSSSAETALSAAFGVPELDKIRMVLVSDIQHGPVLNTSSGIKAGFAYVESTTRVEGLPKESMDFIDEHFNGSPINVKTTTGFDMLMRSEISVPAFNLEVPGEGAFDFGGVVSHSISDLKGENIEADVRLKQTTIKDPSAEIIIAESHGHFNFEKYNDFIMLGGGKFTIPAIDIKAVLAAIKLENFSVEVQSKEVGGKINVKEIIAIEKVIAPLPVTAASYEIEINNIDPKAVEMWYQFSMEMNKMISTAQAGGQSNLPDIDEKKVRDLVSAILQKDLQLNQFLTIEGMGGKITADLDVAYVGLPDGVHPMDVTDPMQMVAALNVNLLIEADEATIMQTPIGLMVGPYVQQGFIVQENGKLVTRAVITGGQMTLNGQPFPLEMLIGAAGAEQAPTPLPEEPATVEEMPQ